MLANTPYDRLRETLAHLEAEGLVERNEEGRFVITRRGREALRLLKKTRELLESLGYRL